MPAPRSEKLLDYVDSRMTKAELQTYHLGEFENKLELEGENFSLYIMDFRNQDESGEFSKNYPIDFYTMGFMETDPVNPNELIAAIIERAKSRGSVLIVPRFENLPNNPAADAEAQLTLKGLTHLGQKFAEAGIDFDLMSRDVEIIGFSDGARTSLELAGLIDQIPQELPTKRILRSLSPTAVIDLVEMPDAAQGNEIILNFTKQVTWITLEETRLRLNYQLELEKSRLNDDVFQRMADGIVTLPESKMGEIVAKETVRKNVDGTYVYPLLAKGFKTVKEPNRSYDAQTMYEVAASLSKLVTFGEGRKIFESQLKESMEINIPFLTDVVVRAITANPNFKPEDFRNGNFIKAVTELLMVYPKLQTHLLANETRSQVANNLSTFDVEAIYPREDLVFPSEAYGRTIRKAVKDAAILTEDLPEDIAAQIDSVFKTGDNWMLGELCIQYPDIFGPVLFPRAKSIRLRYTGEIGKLSASHLAVLKRPDRSGI